MCFLAKQWIAFAQLGSINGCRRAIVKFRDAFGMVFAATAIDVA
jgi:hypothetical protein